LTPRRSILVLAAWLAVVVLAPAPLAAQDAEQLRSRAEQVLGRPLDESDIARLIRDSGLTADELRIQLEQQGVAPSEVEAYISVLEGRVEEVTLQDPAEILQVLAGYPSLQQEAYLRSLLGVDSARAFLPVDSALITGPPIFGKQLFDRATTQFLPVVTGPVPRDYQLGPGDEIILVISGDVELSYRLPVTREGWFVIPDVGRVSVNGLTLDELENVLYGRLSSVYSGVSRGPDATTFFDVSLGELRLNRVFVVGEVERPGAYDVSSLSTALSALYYAGGPNSVGTFRSIAVNRGNSTIRTVDLYDYLLEGRAGDDVTLDQSDVVFVGLAERRVEIDGAIRRPGIYEMAAGEGVRDLIRFAGDVEAFADIRSIQIERVVPFDQRQDGPGRLLIDVDLAAALGEGAESVPLLDGDRVTVFAVSGVTRNQVVLSGAVWRPGAYAVDSDTRLWDLIERAGGLLPDVYADRAQIQRLDERSYTRQLLSVRIDTVGGAAAANPVIQPHDQIYIYALRRLRDDLEVTIGGWVRRPGTYRYLTGMTVEDLVLQAGGLRPGAYLQEAQVSRMVISEARSDTLNRTFNVPLDTAFVALASSPLTGQGVPLASGSVAPEGFVLQPLDAVFIRSVPGFELPEQVLLSGEVQFPGPYSIQTRGERLSSVLERAGGLTEDAYKGGLQLWRQVTAEVTDTISIAQLVEEGVLDTIIARPVLDSIAAVTATDAEETPTRGGDQDGVSFINPFPTSEAPPPPTAALPSNVIRIQEGDSLATYVLQTRLEQRYSRIGVDLNKALDKPGSAADIPLEPNDSIYVPTFKATVSVMGQVGVPGLVAYKKGAGLNYYIEQAGGWGEEADKSRTRLTQASGDVSVRGSKFLFFGGYTPEPEPGAEIYVPVSHPKPISLSGRDIAAIVASLATIVIVATR
jgi:protein involved in polysaccharide export with SLBB domain